MSKRTCTLMIPATALLGLMACEQQAAIPTEATVVRMAVVANADHGGRPYSTPMTQEVTGQPPYAGDADGYGGALITLNYGQGEVCWQLAVSNLDPATAAHIHEAPVFVRGPIVVALSAPDGSGQASACKSDVDRGLIQRILQSPSDFYVNVHTTAYPAGAIRGQLDK